MRDPKKVVRASDILDTRTKMLHASLVALSILMLVIFTLLLANELFEENLLPLLVFSTCFLIPLLILRTIRLYRRVYKDL